MQTSEYIQLIVLAAMLWVVGKPLGGYMARIYSNEDHFSKRFFLGLEKFLYRCMNVQPDREMTWKQYAHALMVFNLTGIVFLLALQMLQGILPLNPQHFSGVPFWLALNTAVSFVTNTNWQAYSGESTMSYLTQMCGLGVQNFLSAATGMAVAVALARGFSRQTRGSLGNFWQDMIRSIIYILLPFSFLLALFLMSQGVIQNFSPYKTVMSLQGVEQVIPMGPVASQIAIKQLGTNGGGFFGVNSAHPFENPTPLSNFLEIFAILIIPFASPMMFGKLTGNKAHGRALLIAMSLIFVSFLALSLRSEWLINPSIGDLAALEGKELRFGAVSSVLWTIATSATSNGSVNAMLSSTSPLTGGVAMLNMMLGEVIYGGVGCGIYGIVMFAILSVFIAGLMVGRSPEYLGKKIEASEIRFAAVAVIVPSVLILVGTSIAISSTTGLSSLLSKGPHGFSEVLYAFSSAAGNNGSAFGGLNANTDFYNGALAMCMFIGRFAVIIPVLGIAGSLAAKKITPPSTGTFPIGGLLFVFLLIGVILIVGALTFFPALCMGPIVEHLLMIKGQTF